MTEFEAGDKINFMLTDAEGEPNWFPGVVHAVRRFETPDGQQASEPVYLVDTGRSMGTDGIAYIKADHKQNKYPTHQPEQLELSANQIKKR